MSAPVRLKISAAAVRFARGEASREEKLQVTEGRFPLGVMDRAAVLLFLCQDGDPEVKAAARTALREFPLDLALTVVRDPDAHPRLLDMFVRLHPEDPDIVAAVAAHGHCSGETRELLARQGAATDILPAEIEEEADDDRYRDEPGDDEYPEEEEEFQTKYKMAQFLGVAEKVKMALTGDKEWRNILIKDANKLVSGAVIKNPRITEAEILAICKSTVQNDEIIRVICANKEWLKNYMIRKALVENHKTPLPNALRYMSSLTEKDLGFMAKSKNISTVLVTNARKLLMNKKRS